MYTNKKKLDNFQYEDYDNDALLIYEGDSDSNAPIIDEKLYEQENKEELVGENIQNNHFEKYIYLRFKMQQTP